MPVLLALIVGTLLLLGLAGAAVGAFRPWLPAATAACGGAGLVIVFAALAAGPASTLVLPFGLPALGRGAGLSLGLDALGAAFLLPVFGAGAACAGLGGRSTPGPSGLLPVLLACLALAVLAADGPTLLLGLGGAASSAGWLVLRGGRDGAEQAALRGLGAGVFAILCLAGALALMAPGAGSGWGTGFATIRSAPPDGWRAAAVLLLTVLGGGSLAGLTPLHGALMAGHPAAPPGAAVLLSCALPSLGVYVLCRVLLDLCGAVPGWWGLPLLALGAASALLGGLRANLERSLDGVAAALTVENTGVAVAGLGAVLAARGADLPSLATLAAAAVVAGVLGHAAARLGLVLAAGNVLDGAGARHLDRLGGLANRMPATVACAGVAALGLAGLPLGAGFAGRWLLLQALMAAPRTGAPAIQVAFAAAAVVLALAAALAAASMVRAVGVGFLGRPRSPRAAAAEEAPRPACTALAGVAGACALAGLLPGPLLALTEGAVRVLGGAGLDGRAGPFLLRPAADAAAPGYAALGLVLLVGGIGLLAWRWLRGRPVRRVPAWEGGFAPPPPWLPFGDPATQYGAVSLAQPLARVLGPALLRSREDLAAAPPGRPQPARYALSWNDPAEAGWAALARAAAVLSRPLSRLPPMTTRRALLLTLAALVAALAAVAWLGPR